MGRVLVELEKHDNTTEVNRNSLQKYFSKLGIEGRFRFQDKICIEDLNWCTSYIAVRPNTPASVELARAIKKSGRFYVVLFDDDLLRRENALRWRKSSSYMCLTLADVLICTNPLILADYSRMVKSGRKYLMHTALEEGDFLAPHKLGNTIRFVYAAGRDHAHFFETMIKPVLNDFLEKNHDKVEFTFVGVEPDVSGIMYPKCLHFVPLMPLDAYTQFMREKQFDVGLAPLVDNSFANRKYFNKYIEYTKAGVFGVYSDCMPYTMIVEGKKNGLLVKNTQEAWLQALQTALEEKELVETGVIEAQNVLRKRFLLEVLAERLDSQIPELKKCSCDESVKVKWKRNPMRMIVFSLLDKGRKLLVEFKGNGLNGTLRLIKNFAGDRKNLRL